MTNASYKRAILAALRSEPDFGSLCFLPGPSEPSRRNLLRWLDRSGLALPLLRQLQEHDALHRLHGDWRLALITRHERNMERTRDMLGEFQRVNAAFRSVGVAAMTLKGFTLTPDFCSQPHLRHQVDFDFLVTPECVTRAAQALCSSGYSTALLNPTGESCFRTPLRRIPSASDDLYALQHQRQVDLHTSVWEPCAWLPLEVPQDCIQNARPQIVEGCEFLSLSLEDKFLLQVLHVFHHSFRSWVRVSWLFEIATFVRKQLQNGPLWNRITSRAGSIRLMKSVFVFVLGLTQRLFQCPIPSTLQSWTNEANTVSIAAWLDQFGVRWAIADWPGSLSNLFLAPEFIPDRYLRKQYLRSRFVPKKKSTTLGSLSSASPAQLFRLQTARLGYVAQRTAAHLKDIAALPLEQFRWKRALRASRRLGFDENC